jgi:uncharacterized membrane protein YhaH (DUF805 family)
MANWFVSINGDQKGPYPTEQLRQLVADGLIPRDAFVWREGMAQWLPLSQVRISDDVASDAAPSQPQASYGQTYQTSSSIGQTQTGYSDYAATATGGYVKPGYFSFSGRIGRQTYWLSYVLLPIAILIVYGIIFSVVAGPTLSSIDEDSVPHFSSAAYALLAVGAVLYILLIISSLAGQVKRLHDRGRSGWFVLLGFVPLANIWILIEVAFLKGTAGPNEYGADPLGG